VELERLWLSGVCAAGLLPLILAFAVYLSQAEKELSMTIQVEPVDGSKA
jgi:hypothetical protein